MKLPRVERPLTRAYYTAWTLTVLFAVNSIAAVTYGLIDKPDRAEMTTFGIISLLAALSLAKVGYYLHNALHEATPRH